MKSDIIVSGSKRSLLQTLIAALLYTLALVLIIVSITSGDFSKEHLRAMIHDSKIITMLIVFAVGFSSIKRIYIDLENSKFRPTFEVLFLKFGKWQTITNYEYVSVFN